MTSQINEIISELKKGLTAEERVQQIKDLNNARNKRYFERHKEAITAKRKAKEAETKLRKEAKPPKPPKPTKKKAKEPTI
jgi:hypothetical protein